ncbi:type II toxin-antitoxin system VapC family toxin [Rhodoferax sp. U2-2l]|uniref:type II toxin-antitoxin system VapC family toxin n=1 Tax=Rhodoferax sp. U2-2l TaxID=2884000 RepID=UPI001D0AC332|nr:type II toxin-antitoxin system VapC family toxin [Rhodoferax sp. U2-2l]MCB8747870.1 type II toxin-antitoxin system VapC family toxin [Rhodoferax sp. U2-2l]
MKYLLDTCVLSELIKPEPNRAVLDWVSARADSDLFTAAMVLAELHRGVTRLASSRRKQELTQWLENLQKAFDKRVLPFTSQTAEHWAAMCARAESVGKSIAAFDSIIAASAVENGLALVTRNVQDFAAVPVVIVNPWE